MAHAFLFGLQRLNRGQAFYILRRIPALPVHQLLLFFQCDEQALLTYRLQILPHRLASSAAREIPLPLETVLARVSMPTAVSLHSPTDPAYILPNKTRACEASISV
jgi:hypothetical protein